MSTLNFGDFLLRPKCLGISHVGVWLGGGRVFHDAPARGEHVSSVEIAPKENGDGKVYECRCCVRFGSGSFKAICTSAL